MIRGGRSLPFELQWKRDYYASIGGGEDGGGQSGGVENKALGARLG